MSVARGALTCVAVNGKIYAIGGNADTGTDTNLVEEYDPANNTWTTKASMPTGRHGLTSAAVNGKIYTIGGQDVAENFYGTPEEYDPATDTWNDALTGMPTARSWLTSSVVNDKIYAIGGQDDTNSYDKIEEYTPPNYDDMVYVDGGCFDMGDNFPGGNANEIVHNVCLDGFYMDIYEVTQADYEAEIGSNPSSFNTCSTCPVEQVNWQESVDYCTVLGKRLPTEAEWEYAARSGGLLEKYAGTSDVTLLGDYAWYEDNSGSQSHPVGEKLPNGLGLYDMTGNIWEWVSDWYDDGYYSISPTDNPAGPDSGTSRVVRGGSWLDASEHHRVTSHGGTGADTQFSNHGFRCAK
jgi:formylglycine-generating enzyme required for sulfatase activity